jgi:hypothetical protein
MADIVDWVDDLTDKTREEQIAQVKATAFEEDGEVLDDRDAIRILAIGALCDADAYLSQLQAMELQPVAGGA